MPIISISFYMVIIRVSIAKHSAPGQSQGTVNGRSLTGSHMISGQDQGQYSMNRVQVHIAKLTETSNEHETSVGVFPYDSRKLDSASESEA